MLTSEPSTKPSRQARLLLYGPSGCGKTAFAGACFNEAEESDKSWITTTFTTSEILEDSLTNLRNAFEAIQRFGVKGLLIENIDYLFTNLRSTPASHELFVEKLQNQDGPQLIIATARYPENLSTRELEIFTEILPILFPDEEGRLDILRVYARNVELDRSIDLSEIAKNILWWNGKEIRELMKPGRSSKDPITPQILSERITFIGQSVHAEKRAARLVELLQFTKSHCGNTQLREEALSRWSALTSQSNNLTSASHEVPNDERLHPNIRLLISRMNDALKRLDYSGVLHASASIFETLAKDIVGIASIQDQTLKSFFDRYRKDSGLPDAVLDYILGIYDSRNVTPLAEHGSIQTPPLSRQEAICLCEMTKAFVNMEYTLRDVSNKQ